MKCLLDTHTVLWFFHNVEKLSGTAFKNIVDPANKKYVSIISAWELAIKISLGKLTFDGGVKNFFDTLEENGFELLPVTKRYVEQVEVLPFIHRDPFDRVLVATAIAEKMSLITADDNIRQYNVSWLW